MLSLANDSSSFSFEKNVVLSGHSQNVLGKGYAFKYIDAAPENCIPEVDAKKDHDQKKAIEAEESLNEFKERVKSCNDNQFFADKHARLYDQADKHEKEQESFFEWYYQKFLPSKQNLQISSHIGHHWNNMLGASRTLITFWKNGDALNDIPNNKVKKIIGTVEVEVLPCGFKPVELKYIQSQLDVLEPYVERYWEYARCNKDLYRKVTGKLMPNGFFKMMGSDGASINIAYGDFSDLKETKVKHIGSTHFVAPKIPRLIIPRAQLDQFLEKRMKRPKEEKTIWEIVSDTYFRVFYPQLM